MRVIISEVPSPQLGSESSGLGSTGDDVWLYENKAIKATCGSREATCGFLRANTKVSKPLLYELGDPYPGLGRGPSKLCHLSANRIQIPDDFNIDKYLSDLGINVHMVPYVGRCRTLGCYELVVVVRWIPLLSQKLTAFKLNCRYTPTEPAQTDICIFGIAEARRQAQTNFLDNAVRAIRCGWGCGSEKCYRDVARSSGLTVALERALLHWDIMNSHDEVHKLVVRILYSPPLGVSDSNRLESFNGKEMHNAQSRFPILSKARGLNRLRRSRHMMMFNSISFPDDHLNISPQLLGKLAAGAVKQLKQDLEDFYNLHPSLRKPENNIRFLFSQSSIYHAQTLKVFNDWAKPQNSLNLYQQLIKDLVLRQPSDQLALNLAALYCRERLLPYAMHDNAPIESCYLVDFNAVLNGKRVNHIRLIFEQMAFSLLRVLHTSSDESDNTIQLLNFALDKKPPPQDYLSGVSDGYWADRCDGLNHQEAFDKHRFGVLGLMKYLGDMNGNTRWVPDGGVFPFLATTAASITATPTTATDVSTDAVKPTTAVL